MSQLSGPVFLRIIIELLPALEALGFGAGLSHHLKTVFAVTGS